LAEKAKLSDVARAAGVSPATVSRVLNNPSIVRAALRQRVEAAIDVLGFRPHAAARTLKSRRSLTIGAVVPTLDVAIFASGISAIQARLREDGYTLLVASSDYNSRRELEEIRVLLERGVDGIIVVGDAFSREAVRLAREREVPLVTTYVSKARVGVPAVGIDNAEAMVQLVRHLLGLGHREFGVLTDASARNDRTRARGRVSSAPLPRPRSRCPPRVWSRSPTPSPTVGAGSARSWRSIRKSLRWSARRTPSPSVRSARAASSATAFHATCRSPATTTSRWQRIRSRRSRRFMSRRRR
jgi:transcriptional regulator with XRE-family HTH domain